MRKTLILLMLLSISIFGDQWYNRTVDSEDQCGRTVGIDTDNSNCAHIVYSSAVGLKYMVITKTTRKITIVDGTGGYQPTIRIDANSRPHIAYVNQDWTKLKYAYYNGSSWQITTIQSGPYYTYLYPQIDVDSKNHPHILYYDNDKISLMYASFDGSSWSFESVDGVEIEGYSCSLKLNSNDNPNIAYSCVDQSYPVTQWWQMRFAIKDHGIWKKAIFTMDDQPTDLYQSIDVDSKQRPCFSYMHSYEYGTGLHYMYYDGTDWQTEVAQYAEMNWSGLYNHLELGSDDTPHISQYYYADYHGLAYTTKIDGRWQTTIIDADGYCGNLNCIAVDNQNRPHIAYTWENAFPATASALRYAYYGPSTISVKTPTDRMLKNKVNITKIYPQPANCVLNLSLNLAQAGEINLTVFDLAGRLVQTKNSYMESGNSNLTIDTGSLTAGVYYLKAEAFGSTSVRNFLISR
jgi:hypothetical protein